MNLRRLQQGRPRKRQYPHSSCTQRVLLRLASILVRPEPEPQSLKPSLGFLLSYALI